MVRNLRAFCIFLLAVAWNLVPPSLAGVIAATPDQNAAFAQGWQAYDAGHLHNAFRIWHRLAEEGYVNAQLNLGVIYDHGQGVPEDPQEAVRWYLAAASQGSSGAQYNLGLMYATGKGLKSDMDQAADWYRKAADQGFAAAQYELATLYATGTGLPEHPDRAIEWFYKSGLSFLEENDHERALTAVEAIKRLTAGHPLEKRLLERILAETAEPDVESGLVLSGGASIGTGWPVAPGYVVTNCHVISGSNSISLVNSSGHETAAWPVLLDEVNDIALLEVQEPQDLPAALPLASSQVPLGASVFTIGFPLIDVMGKAPKLSTGLISGLQGLHSDPGSYQTTVPIQPGNSGGPLLNMRGEVVAVVTAMLGIRNETDDRPVVIENASCARKIQCVKDLLGLLPTPHHIAVSPLPIHRANLETLRHRVMESVMIVMAR
jgi:hypothetical protein